MSSEQSSKFVTAFLRALKERDLSAIEALLSVDATMTIKLSGSSRPIFHGASEKD